MATTTACSRDSLASPASNLFIERPLLLTLGQVVGWGSLWTMWLRPTKVHMSLASMTGSGISRWPQPARVHQALQAQKVGAATLIWSETTTRENNNAYQRVKWSLLKRDPKNNTPPSDKQKMSFEGIICTLNPTVPKVRLKPKLQLYKPINSPFA